MRRIGYVLISILFLTMVFGCGYFALRHDSAIAVSADTHIVRTIKGVEGRSVSDAQDAEDVISSLTNTLGLGSHNSLKLSSVAPCGIGTVYRYDQYYNGIEVYGRQVILLVDNDGKSDSVTANYMRDIDISTDPSIGEEDVEQVLMDMGYDDLYNTRLVVYSIDVDPTLCYYIEVADGDTAYAYFIDASDATVVDKGVISNVTRQVGTSFEILGDMVYTTTQDYFGNTIEIPLLYDEDPNNDGDTSDARYYLADDYRNIILYVTSSTEVKDIKSSLAATVYSTDISLTTLYTDNGDIAYTSTYDKARLVTTYYNTIVSYDYYISNTEDWIVKNGIYEKDSHDYQKHQTEVFAYVGATEYNNAWSSTSYNHSTESYVTTLYFGNGYCDPDNAPATPNTIEQVYYYFGASLDVVAHEYQHSMTSFTIGGGTSNTTLEYKGESGAINEAMSDIFGILIEGEYQSDSIANNSFWYIADEISISRYSSSTYLKTKCMRNIKNPGYIFENSSYYSLVPKKYLGENYYTGDLDDSGVHTNSSVVSYMAYKMYDRGLYTDTEGMGKFWYSTLCILPSTCTMYELGECMLTVAEGLEYSTSNLNKLVTILEEANITQDEVDYGYYDIVFEDTLSGYRESYTVRKGRDLEAPVFTKEGVNLAGWATTIIGDAQDITELLKNIQANATYYARWTDEVNVVFYVGEDTYATVNGKYGDDLTAPANPQDGLENKKFIFLGWMDGDDNVVDIDNELKNVTSNKVYYAKIKYQTYRVRFLLDGREMLANNTFVQVLKYGESAVAPTNPTKTGYDFIGWDKEFGSISSDLDVNAIFEIQTFTVKFYQVTIDADQVAHYVLNKTQENVEYGSAATPPTLEQWIGDYMFYEWIEDYTHVISDLDVHPRYVNGLVDVTFKQGNTRTTIKKRIGSTIEESEMPDIEPVDGCEVYWDYEGAPVTVGMVINAKYTIVSCTVTLIVGDEEIKVEIPYGESLDVSTVGSAVKSKLGFFESIQVEEIDSVTENKTVTVKVVTDYGKVVLAVVAGVIALVLLQTLIIVLRHRRTKN